MDRFIKKKFLLSIVVVVLITCWQLGLHSSLYSNVITDEYEDLLLFQIFQESDERIVPFLRREFAREIVRFQFEMKSFPDIEVNIQIAPDKKTYEAWSAEKNIRVHNNIGFADLRNSQIFIQNPRFIRGTRKIINLLLHEYIHIFIHYHFDDAPLWFHEGLAWFYSENISLNQTFQFMANNAFHKNFLLIKYAYSYPDNNSDIEPYYFQAAMLARMLNDDYKTQLQSLFDFSALNQSFTEAFMNSFYITDVDFLRFFEIELKNFFRLNIYKGLVLMTWMCFPIFLIIAKIKKNHKTRKILAEWEMEEEFLSQESSNE